MFSKEELIQNDEFIRWASNKGCSNKVYWDNLYEEIEAEEREIFQKAMNTIKLLNAVNVNNAIKKQPDYKIEQGLAKLHKEASYLKKDKVFRLSEFLKYAAVILIFLSIGFASINYFSKPADIFDTHLERCSNQVKAVFIETPEGRFYQIPSNGDSWITDDGMMMSIADDRLSFSKTQNYKYSNSRTYKLHVPLRKQFQVDLADGTNVRLNANTTLEFSINPYSKNRITEISGEGYFDVAHNKARPFIVKTRRMDIEVLGTRFNVTAYKNERTVETTLIQGSVKVKNIHGKSAIIKPGDVAIVDRYREDIIVRDANINETMLWTSDLMVLKDNKLGDILTQLSRWYGIDFVYTPKSLKNERFSGELRKNMELAAILRKLEYIEGINFKIDNNIVKLTKEK